MYRICRANEMTAGQFRAFHLGALMIECTQALITLDLRDITILLRLVRQITVIHKI